MSEMRLEHVNCAFGAFVAMRDVSLEVPRRQIRDAARTEWLREDDDLADDRRAGGEQRRPDHNRYFIAKL